MKKFLSKVFGIGNVQNKPTYQSLFQKIEPTDYVTEPIDEYNQSIGTLITIKRLLDGLPDCHVCGGFAAYVAGFTKEYTDIDIFFTNKDSFDKARERLDTARDCKDDGHNGTLIVT